MNSWPFIWSSFILAETREPDDIATGPKTIALLIPWVLLIPKTNDPLAQLPITWHFNNFKICLPCSPSTVRPELFEGEFEPGIVRNSIRNKLILWLRRRTFVLRLSVDGFLCWSGFGFFYWAFESILIKSRLELVGGISLKDMQK